MKKTFLVVFKWPSFYEAVGLLLLPLFSTLYPYTALSEPQKKQISLSIINPVTLSQVPFKVIQPKKDKDRDQSPTPKRKPTPTPPYSIDSRGRIMLEYWNNIRGNDIEAFTSLPTYPNSPSERLYLTSLKAPSNAGDSYGRIRGYIYPPKTGLYVFWITGNNTSKLWLSKSDPNNKKLIGSVPSYTRKNKWVRAGRVSLEKGKKYYVEVLHKERSKGDNLAVGWTLPDGVVNRPIAGEYLSPFETTSSIPRQADMLRGLSRAHPRLFGSPREFAKIRKEIAEDATRATKYDSVRTAAKELLSTEPSKYELPDGIRLLEVSRQVLDRVTKLAFIYQVEPDRRFADQAAERAWKELEAAANFPDWNPKHFLDTAEMAHAFGLGYDWLYDYLSPAQRKKLRDAIVNYSFTPFIAEQAKTTGILKDWPKPLYPNNQNFVSNGGVGIAALAIGDEVGDKAKQVLYLAVKSLNNYGMRWYEPDGGWPEGPTYWAYGTSYLVAFLASLETSVGTDFGLSEHKGFSKTADFPIYLTSPIKKTFNYGDSNTSPPSGYKFHWFSLNFNTPFYAWFVKDFLKQTFPGVQGVNIFDDRTIDPQKTQTRLDRYFRNSEVFTMRSSWTDANALFVGVRGGDNRSGHNHLDKGSFVFDALGYRWALELGSEKLTYTTSVSKRYEFYRLRAEGQNTLVLNPSSAPDQTLTGVAPVTIFKARGKSPFGIVDLSPVYNAHVQKVQRGVKFINRQQVLVQDEITANTPAELWWFMHTQAAIAVSSDGKSAVLSQGKKRLWARIVYGPSKATFTVMNAKPLPTSPNPAGQSKNLNVRKLTIHLDSVSKGRIAVLMVPLDEGENPPKLLPYIAPLSQW